MKNNLPIPKVSQAPMAGCTDLAFRLIARRHGMSFGFLEMISANGFVRDSRNTKKYLKTNKEDQPLGVQLVGSDPAIMADAAVRLEQLGFLLLDLNFGCPVRKVVSSGGGAALLRTPDKAKAIIRAVVRAVKIPVSVKIRKGFDDDSGEEGVTLAQLAEEAGGRFVTVHGRTRAQGYSGAADWEAIKKVKERGLL